MKAKKFLGLIQFNSHSCLKGPSVNRSWYLYTFSVTPCPTGQSRIRSKANFLILSWLQLVRAHSNCIKVQLDPRSSVAVTRPSSKCLVTLSRGHRSKPTPRLENNTVPFPSPPWLQCACIKNKRKKKNNAQSGIPCWNFGKPDNRRHNLLDIKQWEWWCNVVETKRPPDLMLPSRI